MPAPKTAVRLLLALTFGVAACIAAASSGKGTTTNAKVPTSNPKDGSSSTSQASDANQLASASSNSSDVPLLLINGNASNAEPSKIDPDEGVRGPNCHRPDTDGIIRFILIVATLNDTRALSFQFRLVHPNDDLAAAAAAAKADGGTVDKGSYGNRSTGNDSASLGDFGNAAASLNLGNVSLQLVGMIEYLYTPSLYYYDREDLVEFSRDPIEALLKDLRNEVPEKIRPITCLLFRFPITGSSKLSEERILSPNLVNIVRSTLKASEFRKPGKSHLDMRMHSVISVEDQMAMTWLTVNFMMGNFASQMSDVDITHRNTVSNTKHQINTSIVLAMNEADTLAIYEADRVIKKNDTELYSIEALLLANYAMGMKESVLRVAGYKQSDDTLDKNNQTVHKTYNVPCLASNLTLNYTYMSLKNVPLRGVGGSGTSCIDHISTLSDGRKMPVIPYQGQTVHAVRGAYDLLKFLSKAGIGHITHSTTVCTMVSFTCDAYISTVEEIGSAAKTLCQNPPRKGTVEPFYCMNLAILDNLLRDAPGVLKETTVIAIGENPIIDWPLGFSLTYLQTSINMASGHFDWIVTRAKAGRITSCSLMIWSVAATLLLLKLALLHHSPY